MEALFASGDSHLSMLRRAARRAVLYDVLGQMVRLSPARAAKRIEILRALASPKRLQILDWLRDPESHFPPQRDGDLVDDGVCVIFIADKLDVSQPTATTHLQSLARAGLVTSKRIGQWTFYKRNEQAIEAFKRQLSDDL
jgi:DNA-binding transcriptional ArsR family regulator